MQICVCKYKCGSMGAHVWVHVCGCMYIWVHVCVGASVCMGVYKYGYMHASVDACECRCSARVDACECRCAQMWVVANVCAYKHGCT